MRTIKFRQWMGFIKEVPHWHYFEFTVGMCSGVASASLDVNPIMQFTGLYDKHGNEIYEGDIINVRGNLGVVGWCKELASFELLVIVNDKIGTMTVYSHQEGEKDTQKEINIHRVIVGNIFTNRELLINPLWSSII